MRKLLLSLLLLIAGNQFIQALPVQATPSVSNDFSFFMNPGKPMQERALAIQTPAPVPMSFTVISPRTGLPTIVYALKSYENFNNIGAGLYVDVYIRFYEDNACTIPLSVSGLTVNYMILGNNGTSNYQINNSVSANGEYILLEYQNEYDYYDEYTQRYRDYHLLAGAYVPLG